MGNTNRHMRLSPRSIYSAISLGVLSLFLTAGCGKKTQSIFDAISQMSLTDSKGVSVDMGLKLPSSQYVCILGPYTSRVDINTDVSKDLNIYLNKLDFRGAEGSWTFVVGSINAWSHEQISRTGIELMPLRADDGRVRDSICGLTSSIRIVKTTQIKVYFLNSEKK